MTNLVEKFLFIYVKFNNMHLELNRVNIKIEIRIRDIRFVFIFKKSASIFESKLKYGKIWHPDPISCESNSFLSLATTHMDAHGRRQVWVVWLVACYVRLTAIVFYIFLWTTCLLLLVVGYRSRRFWFSHIANCTFVHWCMEMIDRLARSVMVFNKEKLILFLFLTPQRCMLV